jgi:formimidoylglutamase
MNSKVQLSHTTPARWPEARPGRFAAAIRTDSPAGCQIALLGFPDDTGVKLNHGRPGAAEGPAAFRAALAGYGVPWDAKVHAPLNAKVFDAGDVLPTPGNTEAALLETHTRIEQAVREIHKLGLVPVCIGGGHDLTLPCVTALAKHAGTATAGMSFDAHLDVRSEVGSGMAFRRLIESKHLNPRRFAVLGVGRFVNDPVHLHWLADQGARLTYADEFPAPDQFLHTFKTAIAKSKAGFLSIDLDGIDSTAAPGVSALNTMGLGVQEASILAEAAGTNERIRHFDLMELSPRHDPSGRTARVAAHLFLSFVSGFGARLK